MFSEGLVVQAGGNEEIRPCSYADDNICNFGHFQAKKSVFIKQMQNNN